MLTGSQIDSLPGEIIALYQDYEDSILRDIARRLAGLDFATPTAAWEMTRLTESGLVFENALKELAQLTGKSYVALRSMFAKAGVLAVRFDDKIYRAAGLNPLPLNLSPAAANALLAGLAKTGGVMTNMTLTTAIDGQRAFVDAANTAYMQVTNGAMSYTQAIRAAVKNVAAEGISTIDFASGRRDQLDVSMRRTVLTGVGQTTAQIQLDRASEMGSDLIQMSAHAGARPEHQEWQGKIFSISGTSKKYPPFVESTDFGSVTGYAGINCRHSAYPFFENLSENSYSEGTLSDMADKTVEYNGATLSQYEASQIQRKYERSVRYWKRQADALAAADLDATAETAKIRDYQSLLRDFVRQTSLPRQSVREQI